jgi:hypothetical protein
MARGLGLDQEVAGVPGLWMGVGGDVTVSSDLRRADGGMRSDTEAMTIRSNPSSIFMWQGG